MISRRRERVVMVGVTLLARWVVPPTVLLSFPAHRTPYSSSAPHPSPPVVLLPQAPSPIPLLLLFPCSFSPTSITFLSFSCPKFQSTHSSVNEEWKTMVREPGRPPGSCHLARSESERVGCGDESVMAAERGNGPATSRLLGRV